MDRRSTCGTCYFYVGDEDGPRGSRCHRYPTVVPKWADEFCGEFKGDPDKMCRAEGPPELPNPLTSRLFKECGVPPALAARPSTCILVKDHEGPHSWEE